VKVFGGFFLAHHAVFDFEVLHPGGSGNSAPRAYTGKSSRACDLDASIGRPHGGIPGGCGFVRAPELSIGRDGRTDVQAAIKTSGGIGRNLGVFARTSLQVS